jgi:hypothetical protein
MQNIYTVSAFILTSFASILPFYLKFSIFSLFLSNFPPFLIPLFIFFPQRTSADTKSPAPLEEEGGGGHNLR